MSALAEQLAEQIRAEVSAKVEHKNRLYSHLRSWIFSEEDEFDTSQYVTPRQFKNRSIETK